MFAVIVADGCRLVEPGSFWWYAWWCFLAPYTALFYAGLMAVCSAVLVRRRVTA